MKLLQDPLPYAGGYVLHLYCKYKHRPGENASGEYFAEAGREAKAMARGDGWIIHDDRTATCPRCSRKARNPRPDRFAGCRAVPVKEILGLAPATPPDGAKGER